VTYSALPRFALGELYAYALQGALYPVGERLTSHDGGAGPAVVFVHGHGASPGSFLPMRRTLARAGYRRFAAFGYPPSGTVAEQAERLGELVERTLPSHTEVAIVGHSLGGIIGRYWLQELGGAARARAFVSLSTPHRGLGLARLVPVPLIRELVPGSDLMKRLWSGSDRLASVTCVSVVSARDHFVRDPEGAAFHPADLCVVDGAGHAGLLFSGEVHRLVVDRLTEALPPLGGVRTGTPEAAHGAKGAEP